MAVTGFHHLTETEQAARKRLGELDVDLTAAEAVANLHRAVNAVRNHFEQSVLREAELTWTGFVVLWVVWIWVELETRQAAAEAAITKGTLTGVVKTLESRGLIERRSHHSDGRRVLLRLTPAGSRLMKTLFPRFNAEEKFVLADLDVDQISAMTTALRSVVNHLDTNSTGRQEAVRAASTRRGPRR